MEKNKGGKGLRSKDSLSRINLEDKRHSTKHEGHVHLFKFYKGAIRPNNIYDPQSYIDIHLVHGFKCRLILFEHEGGIYPMQTMVMIKVSCNLYSSCSKKGG